MSEIARRLTGWTRRDLMQAEFQAPNNRDSSDCPVASSKRAPEGTGHHEQRDSSPQDAEGSGPAPETKLNYPIDKDPFFTLPDRKRYGNYKTWQHGHNDEKE
jgi:hypothetical protein